jgi:hypothetical protein
MYVCNIFPALIFSVYVYDILHKNKSCLILL